MNGLSWLLYAAEAFDGLKLAAVLISVGLTVSIVVLMIIAGAVSSYSPNESEKATAKWCREKAFGLVMPVIALILLAVVVPGRNTILLIAASEVGETIIATDEAKKIGGEAGGLAVDSLKLLRKYLDDQLGSTPSKTADTE